jgi:hypothetical protein
MNKPPKLPTPRPDLPMAELVARKATLADKATRFGRLATITILAGIALTFAITAYFLVVYDSVVLWGVPGVLISGMGGAALLQVKWAGLRGIEAIDIVIRKAERGFPHE